VGVRWDYCGAGPWIGGCTIDTGELRRVVESALPCGGDET
jgi:hypothetical protein